MGIDKNRSHVRSRRDGHDARQRINSERVNGWNLDPRYLECGGHGNNSSVSQRGLHFNAGKLMKIRRLLIFALCSVLSLCSLAQQVTVSGNTVVAGNSRFSGGGGGGGGPLGFAALPTNWVSNLVCTPTVTATLGTTNNIGPNVTGSAVGQPYALSILGLRDAVNNWRDNADNTSQTPHFADVC